MPQDNTFAKKSFTLVLIAAFVTLLILMFIEIIQVLMLIFLAVLFSVFLRSLAHLVTRYIDIHQNKALLIVLAVLTAIAVGTGYLVGPGIADNVSDIREKGPEALQQLETEIKKFSWGESLVESTREYVNEFSASPNLRERITGVFSSFTTILIALLAVLVIGLYMAFHPGEYSEGFLKLIPKQKRKRGGEILDKLQNALIWWLVGRFVSMAVIGILTTAGLLILGVPMAVPLGIIAALLTFIPNLGPFLAAIPAVALAYIDKPAKALYVIFLYLGIQTIETYLITPQITKKAVSVSPALLISFEIVIGVLLGLPGLIIAVPLLVVVIVLIQTLYIEDTLNDKVTVLGE